MQVTIEKETLEFLESIDVPEYSLETLINVLLIEGIEKVIQNCTFKVDEKDKTKILIKILSLKINLLPKVEKMLKDK